MRVCMVCPAPRGSRVGNRVTALRWQKVLRGLGHTAVITTEIATKDCDVLVALHALRSAEAVKRSREDQPARPVVVALTGTDLYRDIQFDAIAQQSLETADRLIVLHPGGADALPPRHRAKTVFVPQSAIAPSRGTHRSSRAFEVAVVGHLRPEKDPMRTALAARLLPADSHITVVHAGRALSDDMRRAAEAEQRDNPRYRWVGELPAWRARALIARSHVLALTSRMEGGGNVLSEALVADTPIVASRIACTEALLGSDYPGLFELGATEELAHLLRRVERDADFLAALSEACRAKRDIVSPDQEAAAWKRLLEGLGVRDGNPAQAASNPGRI